jgi:putative sterol carrier protein
MPDVYTEPWYESVKEAINAAVATVPGAPTESFTIQTEVVGDGRSPYVPEGATLRFLIRLEQGRCAWYREIDQDDPSVKLDYRFFGPATLFDEIAAAELDPIDAALSGAIKVRGDMRFLIRQAALVQVLLEAYAKGVDTTWPKGRPPYDQAA